LQILKKKKKKVNKGQIQKKIPYSEPFAKNESGASHEKRQGEEKHFWEEKEMRGSSPEPEGRTEK